jgi:ankyrin repeat protein
MISAFISYCEQGELRNALYIYIYYSNIIIYSNNNDYNSRLSRSCEYAFKLSCEHGYLEIAKLFLSLNKNINFHIDYEDVFGISCEYGHLEVAKWLWSLNQNINIHANNNYAFRSSCLSGQIEVANGC